MKNRGLTYGQIKQQIIDNIDSGSTLRSVRNDTNNPLVFLAIGLVFGYVLFSLNSINNALANKDVQANIAAKTLPETNKAYTNNPTDDQPLYVIAIPNKNLYKLGQINFASLVK